MVEACERRILKFPLEMNAREVAKELKREGWYAWGRTMKVLFSGSGACGQKRETEGMQGIRVFDERGLANQFRKSIRR